MTTETNTNQVTGINLHVQQDTVRAIKTDIDLGNCRFGHGIHGMTPIPIGGSISARHHIENRREVIREVDGDLNASTQKYNNSETGPQ